MTFRPLGTTGIEVPVVGLGAGPLGDPCLTDGEADRLLHGALELGVNLVDTAPSYGPSEERIGRAWGHRLDVIRSTKLGYGVPGVPDWTARCIREGVDLARRRLRTDRLDLAHLHSCPAEVLAEGEVVAALADAVAAGRVRVAAYSGDGEALRRAARDPRFGSLQCSLNPWDRECLEDAVPVAARRGVGVLVKRGLGNAPWRFPDEPAADDLARLWRRFQRLDLDPGDLGWAELCLRFAAWQPGVSAVLVGTRSLDRLATAVRTVARGPLPSDTLDTMSRAWERRPEPWPGII